MNRHLFTFLSAISLLLCAATIVLWVRNCNQCDTLSVARYRFGTAGGVIQEFDGSLENGSLIFGTCTLQIPVADLPLWPPAEATSRSATSTLS